MKLKTIENFRLIVLLLNILLNSVCNSDIEISKNLLDLIEKSGIDKLELSTISNIISKIYNIDFITSFHTQTITSEYKEIKKNYNVVLKNIEILINELNFKDPVQIFSLYVYMYVNGYLSINKHFEYSSDMKDFSKMSGVDVIRGNGVCRSISGMLTDIYSQVGYNSVALPVYANNSSIKNLQNLYYKSDNISMVVNGNSKTLVKFIEILTKIIPLSNHQITMVEKDNINYIFDPTNDGFLKRSKHNKLLVPESKDYMNFKLFSYLLFDILGIYNNKNIYKLYKQLSLPTITNSEYKKIYLESLKICKDNIDILEKFYNENSDIYNDICNISNKQRGIIGRLYPVIPNSPKII